jgi:hypothetical protein
MSQRMIYLRNSFSNLIKELQGANLKVLLAIFYSKHLHKCQRNVLNFQNRFLLLEAFSVLSSAANYYNLQLT